MNIQQNKILACLPAHELKLWESQLELVYLNADTDVIDFNQNMNFIYFPIAVIFSLTTVMQNGGVADYALIGNEGLVGVLNLLGGYSKFNSISVQTAGAAYRINIDFVINEFNKSSSFNRLVLRYVHSLIIHAAQTSACNRHHTIMQQLCRALLLNHDRHIDDKLQLTQEQLSKILGVRREGVGDAAIKLQSEGIIRYSRGIISILDRKRLEACSCECYQIVKNEYARLMASEL